MTTSRSGVGRTEGRGGGGRAPVWCCRSEGADEGWVVDPWSCSAACATPPTVPRTRTTDAAPLNSRDRRTQLTPEWAAEELEARHVSPTAACQRRETTLSERCSLCLSQGLHRVQKCG